MSLGGASERSVPATKIEITVSCRNLLDLDTFSKSDPKPRQPGVAGVRTDRGDRQHAQPGLPTQIRPGLFLRGEAKPALRCVQRGLQNQHLQAGLPGTSVPGAGRGDRRPGQPCGAASHGCPRQEVWEHPANCRGAQQLSGHCHHAAVCKQAGQEGLLRQIGSLPCVLQEQRRRFTICHKTEVVKNTLNPVWQPFSIPVRALCNGDYDRTVKIDVYDWDRDGSHDFIGEFTTSYRELSRAQSQFTVYEVLNPRKKCKKKKYVNSGTVTLLSFSVDSEFTFVDYIKGGTQLNFTVAIDFTASNGNPLQPTSLHYMSPYQLSAYALALKAVGEIIQDYDSDKLFPAYGFGAKLPPEGRISHQFPLNNNDEDPNCAGIEGVLESYFQSLRTVQLYGPTYFAPVINQVARAAAKISDGSQYYVLLIITDGVISDMIQTKEAIVSASSLPMSIIIVGVGPAMFEAMEELDGDDVRVSSRGRFAERDIVQFVPFRDYVDRSGNQVLSMARLAKDVLAEIPEQLLSYMRTRDIQPRPPPPANPSPSPAPEQP
ncbi:copine-9 isoform X4 [Cavia porcellus]|uniref:copine-9 isoform X4 n=1 Tax=Cavia porcellus TaxID=10141 RepID=UPI002FE39D09